MERDALESSIEWILSSKKTLVLTGPEISAESGLPDFADPEFNPPISNFRSSREVRAKYWKSLRSAYHLLANAAPNPAHEALAELGMMGYVHSLFTQATDGLHQRAGTLDVIELHSSIQWIICTSCGKDERTDDIMSVLEKGAEVPACEACGKDLLKPGISFPGQPPPHWEIREAWMQLHGCELFLIAGASLDVQPGASLPAVAHEQGAKIVIISERESLADDYAHAVIYGKPSQVLPHILGKIKERIELN